MTEDILTFKNKEYFVGISLGSAATVESGIAILDKDLNLLRVDKAFNLSDLQLFIKTVAPIENVIICIDLPRNASMINGKWRLEAKNTNAFKLNNLDLAKFNWAERFSDRGTELCNTLTSMNADFYRYYCYFTKNILMMNSPYKARTPAACKYLQLSIKDTLKVSGIPSNLIALSGLEAIIGAYTSWRISNSKENEGYKQIGVYKNVPIISPI